MKHTNHYLKVFKKLLKLDHDDSTKLVHQEIEKIIQRKKQLKRAERFVDDLCKKLGGSIR